LKKWEVDVAENGLEAASLFKNNEYDIVLMDISMPEMDGKEASKVIRDWESDNKKDPTPIIALSAHAMTEDIKSALESGMNDYLTKPFKSEELFDKIIKLTS